MPVITNAGGGGGATSDECTLIRANVPTGLKAVMADSDDEALEGTLDAESNASDSHVLEKQTYFKYNFATKRWEKRSGTRKNNGAINATLNCGESYTIPAGDTTGGKVTANSLASQTQGTAVAADIMAGKIATVNGVKITGVKVNHGTINATLKCGESRSLPAGSIDGGTITAASLASQTGGATAEDGYVYNGKTYYKDGALRTGNMSVNSVLSFSAAAYGGKQILLKWQNPYAATGKPFSGVAINYSAGGYPGQWGGDRIYTGIGSNSAPGGWSQVVVTLPSFGTGYYFTLFPYVNGSFGAMHGAEINAYAATQSELWLTFTSSQTYTIPAGYSTMDAFAVGGGGAAVNSNSKTCGLGAGGGYTNINHGFSVSQGNIIAIVVGSGGTNGNGSPSTVARNGSIILEAGGGAGGGAYTVGKGGSGGGNNSGGFQRVGGRGGSDGSDGYSGGNNSDTEGGGGSMNGLSGQGRTTRAWGSGTLYSGGGGAGTGDQNTHDSPSWGGAGGAGGGGAGTGNYKQPGAGGDANTGGGAGGSGYSGTSSPIIKSSGGSGIVLLHVY